MPQVVTAAQIPVDRAGIYQRLQVSRVELDVHGNRQQSAAVWSPFPSPQREASSRRTAWLAFPQLAEDLREELCGGYLIDAICAI
jgi:hypothetical protein